MTTLPPEFVDVLANRLAHYTGQSLQEIRPTVEYGGDALAERMADVMLQDVRRHVGGAHAEYLTARHRLVESLDAEFRTVSDGAGTDVQQRQRARADAERVFAVAVDVVDPVAVSVATPRALERQLEARTAGARGLLRGLPEDRMPTLEEVGGWMRDAERLNPAGGDRRSDERRDGDRQEFVGRVGKALLRAAGDHNYEPRSSTRDRTETLRGGIARVLVRRRLPAFAAALGQPLQPGDLDQLPYGIEGGMADGLVRSIAERSGGSEEEVLDRLGEAADRSGSRETDQWPTAGRLLVPAEALEHVDEYEPRDVGWRVVYAMQDEFARHYGNPDRMPTLTPEEVGAAIVAAGAETAENFGARLPQRDPALEAALNAASVPSSGQTTGTGQGERPGVRGAQQRGTQITGRG